MDRGGSVIGRVYVGYYLDMQLINSHFINDNLKQQKKMKTFFKN